MVDAAFITTYWGMTLDLANAWRVQHNLLLNMHGDGIEIGTVEGELLWLARKIEGDYGALIRSSSYRFRSV